jgi:hypothetical protein
MIASTTEPVNRQVVWQWQPRDEPGIEHLRLHQEQDRVIADGMIIGIANEEPFRLQYAVQCDAGYRFQAAKLRLLAPVDRTLHLSCDEHGAWIDGSGREIAPLQGSVDIDIETSPFTNTLPIRRLALHQGQSAEIQVAYITIPELSVRPERQRYTCLAVTNEDRVYRYESLASGFTAEVRVDADGLVVDYPGLFRRVWFR